MQYYLKLKKVLSLGKTKFNEKHKPVLDSFLLENPLVQPGKMYGHPAYYVGGKLFASLFDDGVCVKIPESRVKELLQLDHVIAFEPMGRKMREWILIIRKNSDDYLKDCEIFAESIDYVFSLTQQSNQKK